MKKYLQVLLLLIAVPSLSNAENKNHVTESKHESAITTLSPQLRGLLTEEMKQLQKGMTDILPLYIAGKWNEIVPIATAIEESYVLKKSLSKKQIHELHTKLPDGFIELDQQFHYLSGMLSHASEMRKIELIGFYYAKMTETCVNCHSKFATHKFPQLKPKEKSHDH